MAQDGRTNVIFTVKLKKAENVGTGAGRPVAVVVAVELLFLVRQDGKSSTGGSGDTGG